MKYIYLYVCVNLALIRIPPAVYDHNAFTHLLHGSTLLDLDVKMHFVNTSAYLEKEHTTSHRGYNTWCEEYIPKFICTFASLYYHIDQNYN